MKKTILLSLAALTLAACNQSNTTAGTVDDGLNDGMTEQEQAEQIIELLTSSETGGQQSVASAAPAQASSAPAPVDDPAPAPSSGVYTTYSASVLTDGQTKVLFFHASWCPTCKAADADLRAWYAADGFPLSVYKVDYDSNLALRSQYGVTYQHTFVKVDGQGKEIEKIQAPTDEQLQDLLS